MKKEDAIKAMSIAISQSSLTKKDIGKMYHALMEKMSSLLEEGEIVRIPGVGTLSVTTRQKTTYRDPQTHELKTKEAQKVVRFRMSKKFKIILNS